VLYKIHRGASILDLLYILAESIDTKRSKKYTFDVGNMVFVGIMHKDLVLTSKYKKIIQICPFIQLSFYNILICSGLGLERYQKDQNYISFKNKISCSVFRI
jgi:hypothetical protein